MGAIGKKQPLKYLRLAIAIDESRESDLRLTDFLESIPEGLKANVIRRILSMHLPTNESELEALLGQTAMDALDRSQMRGRPRQAISVDEPIEPARSIAAYEPEVKVRAATAADLKVDGPAAAAEQVARPVGEGQGADLGERRRVDSPADKEVESVGAGNQESRAPRKAPSGIANLVSWQT